MRPWLPILLLGVVGLAVGGALVILRLHHTIGLGGIGVGGVLIIIGLGGGLLRGRGVRAEDKKTMTQTRQQGGGRKAIVAILVIIVIGVGTFYGTSYLSSVQPGGSSSKHHEYPLLRQRHSIQHKSVFCADYEPGQLLYSLPDSP
jgi:hypothetical protein